MHIVAHVFCVPTMDRRSIPSRQALCRRENMRQCPLLSLCRTKKIQLRPSENQKMGGPRENSHFRHKIVKHNARIYVTPIVLWQTRSKEKKSKSPFVYYISGGHWMAMIWNFPHDFSQGKNYVDLQSLKAWLFSCLFADKVNKFHWWKRKLSLMEPLNSERMHKLQNCCWMVCSQHQMLKM